CAPPSSRQWFIVSRQIRSQIRHSSMQACSSGSASRRAPWAISSPGPGRPSAPLVEEKQSKKRALEAARAGSRAAARVHAARPVDSRLRPAPESRTRTGLLDGTGPLGPDHVEGVHRVVELETLEPGEAGVARHPLEQLRVQAQRAEP